MGQRNFHLKRRGNAVAASWSWRGIAGGVGFLDIVAPPAFLTAPSITGTAQVGQTLTGVDGTVSGGVVSARAWLRDGAAISGATGSTYTPVEADEGAEITFRNTATGAGGNVDAVSAGVGPIVAAPPFSSIAADGWQLTVPTTSGWALQPFLNLRAAFDETGAATTIAETLYATYPVREPYPDEDIFTADQVASSDYVYADDVTIGATNNSTVVSPKPIATWGMMDRTVIGNSLYWEIIPFHRNARIGRQVACVRVRATDGTNTTDWQTVFTTSVSAYCEGPNAVEVYSGTLDISGLNDDSLITLQGQVFPHFGVAASVLDSATESEFRFGPRYFYRNTTRAAAPNLIYVASTGNDAAGVVSTDAATAKATPCLTVGGALVRAAAVLGSASINALSGLEVRVTDGVAMGTVGFVFLNQDAAAIKVTRDPEVTRAAANITMSSTLRPFSAGNSGTELLTESSLIFEDVTITLAANVAFQGEPARKMHVQMRNVSYDWGSVAVSAGLKANSHLSIFGMPVSNFNAGLAATAAGDNRILRGLSGSFNNTAIEGYNTIGCDIVAGRILQGRAERGALIYSNTLPSPPANNAAISVYTTSEGLDMGGVAIVQNLPPRITTATGDVSIDVARAGNITHLVLHHNTAPGDEGIGRFNICYDENVSTPRTHKLISDKGNIGPEFNTKGDIFMSDGSRLGNFAYHHGVGRAGNFAKGDDSGSTGGPTLSFGFANIGLDSVINGGSPLFVDDRSSVAPSTAGSLGGDYQLQAGSPARDLFSEYLLGFDIAGNARPTSGTVDAGVYA